MEFNKRIFFYIVLSLVILSFFETDVEARRKILRGRKTITRTYYRGLEIPGWIIVILSSLGILLINGMVFLILKKWMIMSNDPQPPYRMEHEV